MQFVRGFTQMALALFSNRREVTLVGIAQATAFAGGLFVTKAAAVCLNPDDFGKLAVAIAIANVTYLSLFSGISQAALRFGVVSANGRGLSAAFARSLFFLWLLGTAIVILAGVAIKIAGLAHIFESTFLISTMTICLSTELVMLSALNAARLRLWIFIIQAFEAVFRPAAILSASNLIGPSVDIVLLTYAFSSIIASALSIFAIYKINDKTIDSNADLYKRMLNYAIPFSVFGILGAMSGYGERLLISAWVPWSEVGIYGLMSQVAIAPITLFLSTLNMFYLPIRFQHDSAGSPSEAGYIIVSFLGTAVIAVIISVAGGSIITLLASSSYLGHERLLPVIVLSVAGYQIGQQFVLRGMTALRPGAYLPAKVLHVILLLIVAAWLVPTKGIQGMAIATLVASVGYLITVVTTNRVSFR